MSLYDYYCTECDHVQKDVDHGMNESPKIKCNQDDCNGKCEKLLNNGSFRLIGSGWDSKGRT